MNPFAQRMFSFVAKPKRSAPVRGDSEVASLVEDARLVVRYCARRGLLPNADFVRAIDVVEYKLGRHEKLEDVEITSMISALNDTVRGMSPVTIQNIGSKWRPFPASIFDGIGRFALIILSIGAVIIAGVNTNSYLRLNHILAGLSRIDASGYKEKAAKIYALYVDNPSIITNYNMADALKKEEFDRLRGELETSSDSLSGYVSEALYFLKNASVFPTWNTLRGSARIDPMNSSRYPTSDIAVELLRDYVYRLYVGERVQDEINAPARGSKPKWNGQERLNHLIYADYPDLDALNRYAALGQTSGDSQNSAYHQLTSGPDGPGKALAKTNVGLIGRPKAGADSSQKGVVAANAPTKMLMTENQFLNAIGAGEIAQQVSDQTAVELVSVGNIMETLQMSHDFLETFVLPGLFGVLGTIVFECRRMLDSLRPMDSPWILLVRGALGGLAGLSVALVIRPLESGSNASTFAGLAGFAVAFLFGFSIDVFFAMIERLVSSLVQTVSGENKARTTSA